MSQRKQTTFYSITFLRAAAIFSAFELSDIIVYVLHTKIRYNERFQATRILS